MTSQTPLPDYEKLGLFYLGRLHDPETGKTTDRPLLYDSRDLVTHAVCFGMTGSGKTGLCLALLEEAALDGIPAIAIDPKGDIANLLLTFPNLAPEDFRPWINEDEARAKGLSPDEYARRQAELWRSGLAAWGQDSDRIRRLRAAADFAIYTPGSTAGLPASILRSFAAPGEAVLQDSEPLRERVNATAAALLGLLGIEADPVQSREHILLATVLTHAWRQGRDLDLGALIHAVQSPPVKRIGVMDLETFYPARDRFALAMALNNLLASPAFEAWLDGEPLDPAGLLWTPEGRPRVAIVSIAHLADSERMFFVSLLLNQVLSWMRAQPGTTSLRALLYMDEIFGFFPPVANPPSKQPLLTLLKQARAFGLGVVLATQNPVDLDYKGLANAGTWFIGRLQTDRDRARVLEGLEGVAGRGLDRGRADWILSQLRNRLFLMHNVHEDAPSVFETRWVMCYLRGPLTRAQIRTLTETRRQAVAVREATRLVEQTIARPVLPPEIPQYFLPVRGPARAGTRLVFEPRLAAAAQVRFIDARMQVDSAQDVFVLAPLRAGALAVDWQESLEIGLNVDELEREPPADALFMPLAPAAVKAASYAAWRRDFVNWLCEARALTLYRSPSVGEISRPGESERDFRARLQQAARERRDQAVERLRKSYAPKLAAIEERLRRAEQAVAREKEQADRQRLDTAISFGATVVGVLFGRKTVSRSTLGRAASTARAGTRAWKEAQDVARAAETAEVLRRQLADLEAQLAAEAAEIAAAINPATEPLETITIKPKKSNVTVRLVALCWAPHWRDAAGKLAPAF